MGFSSAVARVTKRYFWNGTGKSEEGSSAENKREAVAVQSE